MTSKHTALALTAGVLGALGFLWYEKGIRKGVLVAASADATLSALPKGLPGLGDDFPKNKRIVLRVTSANGTAVMGPLVGVEETLPSGMRVYTVIPSGPVASAVESKVERVHVPTLEKVAA